ncbi:MAG: protein kinase domain-containing protein [Planctomycetota bacterium]
MGDVPDRIGPYRIDREIGRGGMGVVYLAQDAKLDRDVAKREAKTLAQLHHPRIAAIFGLEELDGRMYLILEYVEGQTLEGRLAGGPLPVSEALAIALQIAEAIEAAHARGVVHRDLKPANIKLVSGGDADSVKVLDFGLAKTRDETAAPDNDAETMSLSPSAGGSPTVPGMVLGTAGYLSPEQARGRAVDTRTDIFSFGCILYEMLTGLRPFAGETASDSVGAALHMDPDWSLLPPDVPPMIVLLLRRCLAKERVKRLQSIGDARLELEAAVAGDDVLLPPTPAAGGVATRRPRTFLIALAMLTVISLVVAGWSMLTRGDRGPVAQLTIALPFGYEITSAPAISPDGGLVVYTAWHAEKPSGLFARSLDSFDHRRLVASDSAHDPFFSPDGRHVAFYDDGKLWRVDVRGGAPTALADAPIPFGGTWGPDGRIVFTPSLRAGLHRIDARGGAAERVTVPGENDAGYAHVWPQHTDDGESVIFTIWEPGSCATARLSPETLEQQRIAEGPAHVRLGGSRRLLYADEEGSLRVIMLGAGDGQGRQDSATVLTGPVHSTFADGNGWFDVTSPGGSLIYVPARRERRLVWVDLETGTVEPIMERDAADVALSPDGERILYTSGSALWLYDTVRKTNRRIESDGMIFTPEWGHEEDRIYFSSNRAQQWEVYTRRLDDPAAATCLFEPGTDHARHLAGVGRDGTIAFWDHPAGESFSLWIAPPGGEARRALDAGGGQVRIRFSPDGEALAFSAAVGSGAEVFIMRYPALARQVQVSNDGGSEPVWSTDGRELFYRKGNEIWAASVEIGQELSIGMPRRVLSDLSIAESWANFALAPDGRRFLVLQREADAVPRQINVILNWDRLQEDGGRQR